MFRGSYNTGFRAPSFNQLFNGVTETQYSGKDLVDPAKCAGGKVDSRSQPAALCSTGEQKALLIGIVLAHADLVAEATARRPVLLLDEVAAHLDPVRRGALFERLAGKGQVWMTGTEPALFEGIGDATRIALGS